MVDKTGQVSNTGQNSRNRRYSHLKISGIPCLRCGVCCRKYQPRLTVTEIELLAKQLGINVPEFIGAYTDRRWPGEQSYLLLHRNGGCLFLEVSPETGAGLCRIHAFKPLCCRDWAADLSKPECREGLKNRFNLAVDSRGRIFGRQAGLDDFEKYVASLKS